MSLQSVLSEAQSVRNGKKTSLPVMKRFQCARSLLSALQFVAFSFRSISPKNKQTKKKNSGWENSSRILIGAIENISPVFGRSKMIFGVWEER